MSLAPALIAVIAVIAVVGLGLALTTAQVALTARLVRRRRPFAGGPRERAAPASSPRVDSTRRPPRISILKPLSGLEDGLEENLLSFARLDGPRHEVIFSVEERDDPALEIVDRVRDRHPEVRWKLVIGGVAPGVAKNPKVARLMAAARHAEGDVLFVSDAQVRVTPRDVAETAALLDDPSVGCVSNLFVGAGARSLGSVVESLHLLTFVAPGSALADFGGVPCVVGKSMALRRDVHDAIGGFAAFSDVLAEDQAIGLAVQEAGFRVVVSPVVVRNVVETKSLGKALDRQIRWGKIRFSFSKAMYTSELLLNPFALAAVASAAAAFVAPGSVFLLAAAAGASGLLRILQAAALDGILGGSLTGPQLLATPLKDLLQLYTQLVPYVSREVNWRGHRHRLGPGTRLLPRRRPAAA